MDILVIARCPPFPLQFGDRLGLYHLARRLSERRHAIDLLAFYERPEDIAETPRYERFFRSVKLIPEPELGQFQYLSRLALTSVWRSAPESRQRESKKSLKRSVCSQNALTCHRRPS